MLHVYPKSRLVKADTLDAMSIVPRLRTKSHIPFTNILTVGTLHQHSPYPSALGVRCHDVYSNTSVSHTL